MMMMMMMINDDDADDESLFNTLRNLFNKMLALCLRLFSYNFY